MRILVLHNYYQLFGGEDQVYQREADMLEQRGHEVIRYAAHNRDVGRGSRTSLAARAVWNRRVHAEVRSICRTRRPDVAHFHNTLPLISPAAYYAARAEGVPVVQTLHNYRIACPAATFFRSGRPCEDCLGRALAWPGVLHGCYRGSRAASASVALITATHRLLRTWTHAVDCYIALTEFARLLFIRAGLPEERIVRKPHFVAPAPPAGSRSGGYAVYVGRLSVEKGVLTLLRAWRHLGGEVPLKIAGTGPLESERRTAPAGVEFLGHLDREGVLAVMREAAFLIFPSECYETFGLAIVEAFACGIPVVCSGGGAHSEIVSNGETGLHFPPGDAESLVRAVRSLAEAPAATARMAAAARKEFEQKYGADRNHELLVRAYELAQHNWSHRFTTSHPR